MFGFVVGALCLVGLVKLSRLRRYGAWHRGGGARRWVTRRLFEELDTTPGQEKVLQQAMSDLEAKAWAVRDAFDKSRRDVAQAMRSEAFDADAFGSAQSNQRAALEALEAQVKDSLRAVHEALGPEQRQRLAQLIELGPRALHHHHGCGRAHRGFGHPSTVAL